MLTDTYLCCNYLHILNTTRKMPSGRTEATGSQSGASASPSTTPTRLPNHPVSSHFTTICFTTV